MKKDRLITGLIRMRLPGSFKTQSNDRFAINRFVQTLREEGQGVQKWSNLHRGHLAAVVDRWTADGLTPATMKSYLASVRKISRAYDNMKIANTTNKDLGIANRVYISNEDKSVPDQAYHDAISKLAKGDRLEQAVGLIIEVARTYGTRLEESYKFSPKNDVSPFATVTISRGTKGGRERTFPINAKQHELANRVSDFAGKKGNLIPSGWTEKSWRQYCYKTSRKAGIGRSLCGASFHGLRHARLHALYQEITGFAPRIKFDSSAAFIDNAQAVAGDEWQTLDAYANTVVTIQAGHGADRHVYKQYLGATQSQ